MTEDPEKGGEVAPDTAAGAVDPASAKPVNSDHDLEQQKKTVAITRQQDENASRKVYSYGFALVLSVQLGIADAIFWIYGASNDWHVPGSTMDAWLGASVVQVIGIVLVITRYLFRQPQK
jgi:hypothetical protein